MIHAAMHVPQQQLRIQIFVAQFTDPPGTPDAESFDHRAQFAAGVGQTIADDTVGFFSLHDAGDRELVKPGREQSR